MYQTAQQTNRLGGGVEAMAAGVTGNAKQQPELQDQMDRLAQAIACGEELASQLQARLSGVMAPPSPVGDKCGNAPSPMTYYGQQLCAATERIAGVNESMRDMLDRLQA